MTNKIERDFTSLKKAVSGIRKSLKQGSDIDDVYSRLNALEVRLNSQLEVMSKFESIANRTKNAYDELLLTAIKKNSLPDEVFFDIAQAPDVRKISDALSQNGICIIRDETIVELARNAQSEMNDFLEKVKDDISKKIYTELDDVIIDGVDEIKGGHNGRAGQDKAVLHVRGGADDGLVDVFNADRIFPSLAAIKEGLRTGYVKDVIDRAIPGMEFENINVYINKGVTKTRGFHYDSRSPVVKIFIVLTDVPDHSYGPYCYELGSHLDEVTIEESFSGIGFTSFRKNDAYFSNYKNVIACLGKVGDIVISYQHGSHRGFPQSPDRTRMMGVQVLRPKKP
ncbi:hypothetical protein [Phaeobacter sp. B1627]|uniref:hypothetical protein n=1 Tax=Phaeobacter sp. B1627 TaxID=2583809 RepID=UPI00111AA7A4|nr:hypothetical protein [Phaeobacter sp. B1627]TNJ41858.1 hypothetical protein FGE21_13310 [Phaeobacter sp. B1627]